jgi:hypothetical protein
LYFPQIADRHIDSGPQVNCGFFVNRGSPARKPDDFSAQCKSSESTAECQGAANQALAETINCPSRTERSTE